MAEAILCNLSSCGSLSALSLSLKVKESRFFVLGGASVNIGSFHFARGPKLKQEVRNLAGLTEIEEYDFFVKRACQ